MLQWFTIFTVVRLWVSCIMKSIFLSIRIVLVLIKIVLAQIRILIATGNKTKGYILPSPAPTQTMAMLGLDKPIIPTVENLHPPFTQNSSLHLFKSCSKQWLDLSCSLSLMPNSGPVLHLLKTCSLLVHDLFSSFSLLVCPWLCATYRVLHIPALWNS